MWAEKVLASVGLLDELKHLTYLDWDQQQEEHEHSSPAAANVIVIKDVIMLGFLLSDLSSASSFRVQIIFVVPNWK